MNASIYAARLSRDEAPGRVLQSLVEQSGILAKIKQGDKVLVKPNYVAPFPLATTDSRILEFFIQALKDLGARPVVGEMSGYEFDTEATIKILGILPVLERHGVEFVNFEQAPYESLELDNGMQVEVARIAREVDLIVNLPVLKGHTITKVTGAVKNLFGLLSRNSRRRLHCRRIHAGVAALARSFPAAVHCVDARSLLDRAVFGASKPLNVCMMGSNPFALDHFGSKLLGIDPDSVYHLEHVPSYTVTGDIPPVPVTELRSKNSLKECFHRMVYSSFYYLDELNCGLLGRNSVIPELHWQLGVHPDVSRVDQERIAEVCALCPVEAIDPEKRVVRKERCITVRCLRCYQYDPTGQVVLKGLNPPKGKGR